jgi:hypothetical protein
MGVTMRQVMAGSMKQVTSVSPPMLSNAQRGTMLLPRNMSQPMSQLIARFMKAGIKQKPIRR